MMAKPGHVYTRDDNNGTNVFVYGSNTRGVNGAGAALAAARDWGAERGVGEGRTGMAYAIPTKDAHLRTRTLAEVRASVLSFLAYAREHQELTFCVTAVGTGLAGIPAADIAPFFRGAPKNCVMPAEWRVFL